MTTVRAFWSCVIALAAATLCLAAIAGANPVLRTAEEAVRAATVARLGSDVDITILSLSPDASGQRFREARIDPAARLGRPVRVTLVAGSGASVSVTAVIRVVANQVVARRAIERGSLVAADDVRMERRDVVDAPMRALPNVAGVVGGRALRTIQEGAIVLPGFVAARRVVEPGDRVTVVALAGQVQVTADFVAADGGRPGDVIRVVNPATKRYIRGRIVKEGWVEVGDGR